MILNNPIELLRDYWWVILLCAPIFWIGYYLLIGRRRYKLINGRLHVKEGLSKWEDLEEHMKREHPHER